MIERLYPGVYVDEISFRAAPIDGGPRSSIGELHAAAAATLPAGAALPSASPASSSSISSISSIISSAPSVSQTAAAPQWTDAGQHDPGITLTQLFAWLADSSLFRNDPVPAAARHTRVSGGSIGGLKIETSDGSQGSRPEAGGPADPPGAGKPAVSVSPGLALDPGGDDVAHDNVRLDAHISRYAGSEEDPH